eukprot:COSAG04_NODE_1371_length_7040_cov_8.745714_2_plen_108_part_00
MADEATAAYRSFKLAVRQHVETRHHLREEEEHGGIAPLLLGAIEMLPVAPAGATATATPTPITSWLRQNLLFLAVLRRNGPCHVPCSLCDTLLPPEVTYHVVSNLGW